VARRSAAGPSTNSFQHWISRLGPTESPDHLISGRPSFRVSDGEFDPDSPPEHYSQSISHRWSDRHIVAGCRQRRAEWSLRRLGMGGPPPGVLSTFDRRVVGRDSPASGRGLAEFAEGATEGFQFAKSPTED
jgi:hypothetical protein